MASSPTFVQHLEKNEGERMLKEERVRMYREHQEEERQKKLKDIEQQFIMSKMHREQLEEERKRKIEEARLRELERRNQVEERKRQIWEAEQERKEAILRRNLEREARIEARRNAQRNSQYFAFGSSTPRTFDFDLAAIGRAVSQGPVLMSSVSNKRSEDRESGPPRATSACSLDRKYGGEDCMSRSMISLSTFRGRKRTDVTLGRERSITPHIAPRGKQSMRAVSMTRLDQLAQPRQIFREHRYHTNTANDSSSNMSKSMCNLANSAMGKKASPTNCHYQSLLHLADKAPNSPTKSKIRPAQSMMHLAAPPRLTRAAKLRAQALSGAKSAWNLNKTDLLSPGKDTSRSPSRPQSSMSGTSEISATSSSVSLRAHSAYRRPRPISVAGSIADSSVHLMVKKDFEQQSQLFDKNASAHRTISKVKKENSDVKKKPIPPPKSSAVLARAHPAPPVKDNLRKAQKPAGVKISNPDTSAQNLSKNVPQSRRNVEPEMKVKNTSSTIEIDKSLDEGKDTKQMNDVENLNNSHQKIQNDSVEKSSQIEKETQIKNEDIHNNSKSKEALLVDIKSPSDTKPRVTSEEEARIALAEKRRLAREQAERDAELERLRLEEVRRKEEECKRLEEAEQKRVEEEQIRLAALHRQFEEEKLRKAIEEQQQRELEEQKRKEEELRQRTEREELERKVREEAEKQRIELEEKLRKEEEERAERKKRVEQIMARTRNKMAASSNESPKSFPKETKSVSSPMSKGEEEQFLNGEFKVTSGSCEKDHSQNPLPDILTSEFKTNGIYTNYQEQLGDVTDSANLATLQQSNGHSSHEDMSCTTSPDETSEGELLIDIQSCDVLQSSAEFSKPHNLDNSVKNENFLINVDDFNSNIIDSGSSFDDTSLQRNHHDTSVVPDLLS